jgi:NADPH2:quinone reductase
MRAWWLRPGSAAATVEAREVAVPEPAAGQLLVRMQAAGLNRGEFMAARGLARPAAPRPAGGEGAGDVVRLGEGVTGFRSGDRVMGRCPGAFAEYALMPAAEAIAVPAGLEWEAAGAIPLVFLVVHDMLIAQGGLRPGEWLLVTGVASGVGVAALQVGKFLGARVIGTSRSREKLARLAPLGLDLALCTRDAGIAESVLQATDGRGADLVVNTVGGSVFADCERALGYQGRLAMVGYLDGVLKAEIDLEALHAKRLKLFGVSNRLRGAEERARGVRAFIADLLPAFAEGRLRPIVDRVFAFDALPEAQAYMESDAQLGKIVLRAPAPQRG